jgi:hypothetical protein
MLPHNLKYADSLRLLAGQDFSEFSGRRPLFAGLFSVLLRMTGHNRRICDNLQVQRRTEAVTLSWLCYQCTSNYSSIFLPLIIQDNT